MGVTVYDLPNNLAFNDDQRTSLKLLGDMFLVRLAIKRSSVADQVDCLGSPERSDKITGGPGTPAIVLTAYRLFLIVRVAFRFL
jgi:hypothetical protein